MRTILDIDRELLEQAKTALQQPSFTATVNEALREAVQARRERRRAALRELAKEIEGMDEESRAAWQNARAHQW